MFDFLITHSPLLYFTQSLWRDEAFSILLAKQLNLSMLPNLGFEPPFYYLLLNIWLQIFGTSEIAARSLSLLGFLLATLLVGLWAEKHFRKNVLLWFLPVSFFLNPLLLYYGFEVRTYGWYTFFTVASILSYLEKKWLWYTVATILGFYTHAYFLLVPFAQTVHWFFTTRPKKNMLRSDGFFRAAVASGLFMIPWLIQIGFSVSQLRQSWYFPVDWQLVRSVLGNLFLGYEGTPWYLWRYTALLSIIILGSFILALLPAAERKRNLFFVFLAIVPLLIILGISTVKPLFVNRYLLPVTVAEVFLLAFAINALKNSLVQHFVAIGSVLCLVAFNLWFPSQHAKLDIRPPVSEVNTLLTPTDLIYVDSPLIYFETVYYAKDPSRVYLFNPDNHPFPWYVGGVIFPTTAMTANVPQYPRRAFTIHEDGSYDIMFTR